MSARVLCLVPAAGIRHIRNICRNVRRRPANQTKLRSRIEQIEKIITDIIRNHKDKEFKSEEVPKWYIRINQRIDEIFQLIKESKMEDVKINESGKDQRKRLKIDAKPFQRRNTSDGKIERKEATKKQGVELKSKIDVVKEMVNENPIRKKIETKVLQNEGVKNDERLKEKSILEEKPKKDENFSKHDEQKVGEVIKSGTSNEYTSIKGNNEAEVDKNIVGTDEMRVNMEND